MMNACFRSTENHNFPVTSKFLLPENAIRRLFPHHKIKTTLEDGVRPGTGMKRKTDQRGDKERQERIKLCVKNQSEKRC